MKQIDVILSPLFAPLCSFDDKLTVVIDVLRATSSMAMALEGGCPYIRTVLTVEEAFNFKSENTLIAGERNGQKYQGFDLGNSPFEFLETNWINRNLVLTTTNGTRSIALASQSSKLITAAFVNLDAVVKVIEKWPSDVVLFCAGWKDHFNMEDSLFAGAILNQLSENFSWNSDAALACETLYLDFERKNKLEFLPKLSHAKRLSNFNMRKDVDLCFSVNRTNKVPLLNKGLFIKHP